MEMTSYRNIQNYKYQITSDFKQKINLIPPESIESKMIKLSKTGILRIKNRYVWDGPSGLTIDTDDFMRGSLIHDALYQLMRESLLDLSYRKQADKVLREVCIESGMRRFRAWYVYKCVRLFGRSSAKPRESAKKKDKLL